MSYDLIVSGKNKKRKQQQEPGPDMKEESDPQVTMPAIGMVTYSSPMAFDDVAHEEFRTMSNIPWFRRQNVLQEAESDFEGLDRYLWEGDFY